jgi:hypothetical protein
MTSFQSPLKIIFIDRKKAGIAVPAWPFLALSFFLLGTAAFVVKKWFVAWIPTCGLHKMTGLACPTCGASRMAFFFLEGKFIDSFLVQPFMFMVLVFFTVWIVSGMISFLFGKLMFIELSPFWQKYFWVPLVVLFLLNWVYLLKKGI